MALPVAMALSGLNKQEFCLEHQSLYEAGTQFLQPLSLPVRSDNNPSSASSCSNFSMSSNIPEGSDGDSGVFSTPSPGASASQPKCNCRLQTLNWSSRKLSCAHCSAERRGETPIAEESFASRVASATQALLDLRLDSVEFTPGTLPRAADNQQPPISNAQPPIAAPEPVIRYGNRDILDLGSNIAGGWGFQPARLPPVELASPRTFYENASTYSRIIGHRAPPAAKRICKVEGCNFETYSYF